MNFEFSKLSKPPALTTGLPIFLVLFYVASFYTNVVESLSLGAPDFLHPTFDLLNKLSFYQVVHLNWIHLVCNIIGLTGLLWEFEVANGTVRTGVLLNVLSVFPGLVYCIVASLCGIEARIVGASGWVFSFLGYSAWTHYLQSPAIAVNEKIAFPTWLYPIAILMITFLVFPYSSFAGHAIALGFGYLLGMGYLAFSYDGTSKVVAIIESHIQPVIVFLGHIVNWFKEIDVRPPVDEGHVLGV